MALIHDDWLTYARPGQEIIGVCHLRVYRNAWATVAICGELSDNPGPSVTNSWEVLAPMLTARYGPKVLLVEHYPPSPSRPGKQAINGAFDQYLGENRWAPLTRRMVEEVLVGEPVPVWPEEDYVRALVHRG